ncbi:DNA mismatch repair endonuclease MutL [Candidatus Nitronereus thalassa]|uniref:DNA mismatch repair protein MutL n=1 Tax=Candidatus Nitronereus thalassa TaxID=3020898 RepID=A0ABU3KBE5_9BACT|nr:DNA mismatch repair endonuclease MutL [Candidatus Nitronereus thalassa]MDT7043652.1 DNA mismatch repair endonuclease MutL [Candidatus Nitronereus thalassa]
MTRSPDTKIRVLPDSVSCQIAAGEIVDRPASVVKELLDNSLDAGSSMIAIDVVEGGKRLIRVTDNGEGMTRADAQMACQRFATSKLSNVSDLLNIATYGFRGEALPSIASVSKFSLLTGKRGESVGTQLIADGGPVSSMKEQACPPGTRIDVAELFYNTPGRQKFLKSTPTEFSHICHVVQQAALASPGTQFRLTHNDNVVFDFPAVDSLQDRLLQLYGTRVMDQMLPLDFERGGLKVEGVTINPYHARTSRSPQEMFVNGRVIKNTTISHAIYEAYGSFLPKGRHPVFALFLTIDPAVVDVNVHPAKREVKFSAPDMVHRVVKEAVRRPLQRKSAMQPVDDLEGYRRGQPSNPRAYGDQQHFEQDVLRMNPSEFVRANTETGTSSATPEDRVTLFSHETLQSDHIGEAKASYLLEPDFTVRVLGQISHTYIVAQVGEEFHVVDQHTVHERVLFERLWRSWVEKTVQSQSLLIPEPIELQPHTAALLQSALPELSSLGLEMEPFGETTFVIRSVSALLGPMDYAALVQDLVEDLTEWKSLDSIEKRVRPILASMACQGAVQAGRAMAEPEMKLVLEDWVQEGFPMTCPHGRRVTMRFSMDELHKIFRRI